MQILKLKPVYDQTIWANDTLVKLRGGNEKGVGTSWEISAHPYCTNKIVNGRYQGKTLQEMIDTYPKEMLGVCSKDDLLRCAFLDAKSDLSIQVHPYEEYALAHDHDHGKTESWYILKADKGRTLVAGTNTNDLNKIKEDIQNNKLVEDLVYQEVMPGDFIHIPAGMLHALGGGILAIEFGTNSNTTYRFYDYGRKDKNGKGRELHLDKSFDVVDLNLHSSVTHHPLKKESGEEVLVDCKEYKVELLDVYGSTTLNTNNRFNCLVVVDGSGYLNYQDQKIALNNTDSLFVPAAIGEYTISGNLRVIKGNSN